MRGERRRIKGERDGEIGERGDEEEEENRFPNLIYE